MKRKTVRERAAIATMLRERKVPGNYEVAIIDLMCEYERGWLAGYRAAKREGRK